MNKFLLIRLLILSALVSLWFSFVARTSQENISWWRDNDFAHYWVSSKLTLQGIDPYKQNEPDLISSRFGFSPVHHVKRFTNPPALIALLFPFTFLSPSFSFWIWSCSQVGALIAIWKFLEKVYPVILSKRALFSIVSISLLCAPMYMHLRYGQTQLFIAALLLYAVRLFNLQKIATAGFIVGLATSLKLFTWPLVFYCYVQGGRRALLGFALGLATLTTIGVLPVGPSMVESFCSISLPYIYESALDFTANLSLPSALHLTHQIFGSDDVHLLLFYRIFSFILLIGFVAYSYWHAAWGTKNTEEMQKSISEAARQTGKPFKIENENAEANFKFFSILCLASVMFGPTSWPHYLHLCLPAIWFLINRYQNRATPLLGLTIVSLCLAFTLGVTPGAGPLRTFISGWWGFFFQAVLLVMILRASIHERSFQRSGGPR